jgi:hypothetical protein
LVEGVDAAGSSVASTQLSATTHACPATSAVAIDSGGTSPVSSYLADTDLSEGTTITTPTPIDVTGVSNQVPADIYQSARTGNFSYTVPGFTPGSSHSARLHFAELIYDAQGARTFNVIINGTTVLSNFDVFAAGDMNKAIDEQFTSNANSTGSLGAKRGGNNVFAAEGRLLCVAKTRRRNGATATQSRVLCSIARGRARLRHESKDWQP